jgi:hypothetical protein
MVVNFKVFKKASPNSKISLFMGKRDFVDHISAVEPIEGIIVLDDEYIRDRRKVFGQGNVISTFLLFDKLHRFSMKLKHRHVEKHFLDLFISLVLFFGSCLFIPLWPGRR